MTKGIRDLRKIEIGFQGLATGAICGTEATPTARLVGTCEMKKLTNLVFPTEATGVMSDHIKDRVYSPWVMAELPLKTGEEGLTFQQFPWYLAMGAQGGVTGTGTLAYHPWEFCPDLAAGDMPEVATIIYGDNVVGGVWKATCCFARQLVISAAFQGPWQIEADVVGRDMVVSEFEGEPYPTDVASYGPLETILGQLTSFYVKDDCTIFTDPTTSLKTGSLIDWRVTLPGFHPKFFQDGELYYTTMGLASRHLTLEATVEWDSVFAAAEHAAWILETPRYMRIEGLGSAIGTVSAHTARIDEVLMYESFETLEERDGNDIVKFTARTVYDVTCIKVPEWCITVINTFDALP